MTSKLLYSAYAYQVGIFPFVRRIGHREETPLREMERKREPMQREPIENTGEGGRGTGIQGIGVKRSPISEGHAWEGALYGVSHLRWEIYW